MTTEVEYRLKKVSAYISRMPSLSTTVTKVLEICNTPDASANDLNRVISYDPVLTGQVLKLINSAYYGLRSRVTSLTRAIIMLGVNTVKNLVLATSVLASFKRGRYVKGISMDSFWAHSLCVGSIAKAVAKIKKVSLLEQEEFFVAGLLHDLGKLPMIACFGQLYEKAFSESQRDKIYLFEAENTHIGFNHCQVGLLIATKWQLNKEMQHAMAHHHTPLEDQIPGSDLLYYTSLANQMAYFYRIGSAGDHVTDEALLIGLAERIGVEPGMLLEMKSVIEEEIEKAKIFLNMSDKV
jgi:putative nucleotidyltransferase with HDIG domain